jgi:colanic acid/amylovoran biosynthesis glycosyltransferase
MDKSNIVIFRNSLLPKSETFIYNQSQAYTDFQPYFMAYNKTNNGLSLPSNLTCFNSMSRQSNTVVDILKKKTGYNPTFNQFLKNTSPKLIHAHFGPDGVLARPFAKRFNIPLFVTFHGYDMTVKDDYLKEGSFNVRHYVKNRKKLHDKNIYYIAVSSFIKTKLLEKGFPEDRIYIHHIGVDTNRISPDNRIQRKEKILFVARLIENKGCKYLLNALQKLPDFPTLEVDIIGEGPERESLEKVARKSKFKVNFLGAKPYDEVIRHMNKAKILCVPSIEISSGASEGFGMVFAEASAMGLPVVSFDTGGISEAVRHTETGFLAKPNNTEELSEYLNTLLSDKNLWNQMSTNSRKHAENNLNISVQTKKLENIYREVLLKQ